MANLGGIDMLSSASKDGNIVYGQFQISVHYKNLRFPLDPRIVAYYVTEKGWVVPPEMATLPIGGQITGSGLIASKASSQLRFNTEGKNIVVVGRNPETVSSDFEEVEKVIKDQIDFDGVANAGYYELIAAGYTSGPIEASKAWKQFGGKLEVENHMPSILNESPTLFGIHLQKPNQLPSDIEWWDLSLTLQVTRPDKYHNFQFVKRSTDRQAVLDSAKETTSLIQSTVGLIQ